MDAEHEHANCDLGFEGFFCQDIDECAVNADNCDRNAACINTDGSFICVCDDGYSGFNCETDDDECQSAPCMNGGVCTDRIASFDCTCPSGWEGMTWRQTEKRVRAVACGLHSLNLPDESRCAVLSATRMEWILADLGILAAGCATTTVYPTTTPQEYGYILNDSESQVIFAETSLNADQLLSHREDLPQVRLVVVLDNSLSMNLTDGARTVTGKNAAVLGTVSWQAKRHGTEGTTLRMART